MNVSQTFNIELCCAEGLPRWRYEWRRYVHAAVQHSAAYLASRDGHALTRAEYRSLIRLWGQEFFGAASFRDYIARRRQVQSAQMTVPVVCLASNVTPLVT